MPLSPGEKLGPYEILSAIGAGGMGEVYKARDARLDRTVAIKVLPEHIAQREDVRSRFEREARAVASLNHPNICVLHDIGEGYMVMELIEGETLAQRIEKGPIPLDQSLKLATQIADALDRAHRAGVTHRDVKPQNIMLTRDGVKVLDFGLAKSVAKPGPTEATLTHLLTTEGTVMGTPQYMAPEQFAGKEADARSDIWAFGAVLYEMVTGRKAFQGSNYQSLVGAILAMDPAPMAVKPFTPSWLERLVHRCLAKDPDDRYLAMHDIALDLKSPPAEVAPVAARSNRWPWAVAGVLALTLSAVSMLYFSQKPPEQPMLTTSILPPDKAAFHATAISPDGKLLAFTATAEGKQQLWVRPLHSLAAQPLTGTDQAAQPFWSPDSRWIGFFTQGKLKKIEASGGPAQTLCEVGRLTGATWNQEGVIVYGGFDNGLWRVASQGGTPTELTIRDSTKGETGHMSPLFLPGGRRYLYQVMGSERSRGIYLGVLDSKERTKLLVDQSRPRYAEGPAGEGYLLFVRETALMAQHFDAAKGVLIGESFPVAEKAGGNYSVSRNGMLVYGAAMSEQTRLTWMDRAGKRLETLADQSREFTPSLSPDGKQVAFILPAAEGSGTDVWVRDLARGVPTRFTFHPSGHVSPVWSPDGSRIVFSSAREGLHNLYLKSASGTGQEERLLKPANTQRVAADWTAKGDLLLYYEEDPKTKFDLWVMPMTGERKPAVYLKTQFNERWATFSPDGKWIAYTSDESGRFEIYVQPYPVTGAKWQVSRDGGRLPKWRRDGKEIYWLDEGRTLMKAEVSMGQTVQLGNASELFETRLVAPLERYAVTADGQRFLVPMRDETSGPRPLTVVQNWLAGARR